MHKVVAQLELKDPEVRVLQEMAASKGMDLQAFLDRCLARGIEVEEGHWAAWRYAEAEGIPHKADGVFGDGMDDAIPF